VDKLAEGGAKVIGFDANFAESDNNPGLEVIRQLKEYAAGEANPSRPAFDRLLDRLKGEVDFDTRLANSLRNARNVVLGVFFFRSEDEIKHVQEQPRPERSQRNEDLISTAKYSLIRFPAGSPPQPLQVYKMVEVEPNLPELSKAARSVGHFNVIPDPDGVFRRIPLLLEYKGAYYASLDMEVVRQYLGSPQPIIHADRLGGVSKIQLGAAIIPCDGRGQLLVNYYGPARTFPHYSFSDVVDGTLNPSIFKDKIVLVGSTAIGIHDLRTTPFQTSQDYPGVEIHANVIENILQKRFLARPDWISWVDSLVILGIGFLSALTFSRLRPVGGAIAFLILFAGLTGLVYYAFAYEGLWLNFTFPGILMVMGFIGVTGQKYLVEEHEKRKIRGAFEHYVAPTVVGEVLKNPEKLNLGGERKALTVLFSDIRGFTTISEHMNSQDLVGFLNEYLTVMTDIVFKYEGTLDKYMGDAIMAFYGAPLEQKDHPLRACLTAIDMMEELKKLHVQWEVRKLPKLDIGIGINSGEMTVGNMGSKTRFDYTVLGDAVNLASRLEGANKYYGTHILLSEDSYKSVKDQILGRRVDILQVKGKEEPVVIYELLGKMDILPKVQDLLELFQRGLEAYRARKWSEALAYFEKVLQLYPRDAPSVLYIKRCQEYILNPPPPDWDGIFKLDFK